jgi:hypothetical protein
MTMKMVLRLTVAGAVVACTFGTGSARADTVTEWNAIMQATVTAATVPPMPPTNPHYQSRWGAIVQLAVFEAVNAIVGDYEPYLGVVEAPAWASPDAAVIAAAHRTLVTLRPDRAAALNVLRDNALAAIPNGPAKEAGILAGEDAAAALLLLRADDGSVEAADTPYTPGTGPGDYRPLPGQTPLLPGWGQVTPFGLLDVTEFRLPPPPALDSGRYADDYNDVKRLGSLNSPFRPQDRTDVARFYAVTSPTALWNSAARQASAAQGKTHSENAQIFALLAMAMGDASIAMWDTKYHYNFWRPQAAIREGDTDGNPDTVADPDWLPLIATPAHPSYASGHACGSGAARRVLEWAFGKDGHDITLTNPALPTIVLDYTAWDEITDDIDDARIYGGIHFWFDQEAGARMGRHVSSYILENYLRSAD